MFWECLWSFAPPLCMLFPRGLALMTLTNPSWPLWIQASSLVLRKSTLTPPAHFASQMPIAPSLPPRFHGTWQQAWKKAMMAGPTHHSDIIKVEVFNTQPVLISPLTNPISKSARGKPLWVKLYICTILGMHNFIHLCTILCIYNFIHIWIEIRMLQNPGCKVLVVQKFCMVEKINIQCRKLMLFWGGTGCVCSCLIV